MLRSPSYERSDDDLDLDFFDDSRGKITDTGISAHLKIASEGDLDGHSTYKVSLATGKQLVLMRDPMAGTGGRIKELWCYTSLYLIYKSDKVRSPMAGWRSACELPHFNLERRTGSLS